MNLEKTEAMQMKTSHSSETPTHMLTNLIELSEKAEFLGVFLVEKLTWEFHIQELTKKLGSTCFPLDVLRYLDVQVLKIIYQAVFE